MAIDGSSAVQNEKIIVFINNICSINQITVPIVVMQYEINNINVGYISQPRRVNKV